MNELHDLFEDVSDQDMARVKDRVVQRGTQIRRRNFVIRTGLVALAVCAVAVPLIALSAQEPAPTTAIETTSAGPFQDVVWTTYFNPALNVSAVHFPGNIGCNPGNTYKFQVVVQQVHYIRVQGSTSPIALALVHCNANNPPSSLYAFTFPRGAAQPHVLQTLLAPPIAGNVTIWYGSHLSVSKGAVLLQVRGVTATDETGLCCPNVAGTMRWTLRGTHFVHQKNRIHRVAPPAGSN
ncbi:MAG TPA: hypothetical protein VGG38_01320 [Acidimicrobiales bacterium]|jgi:hypothetical protein